MSLASGSRIRSARIARNLTQGALAEKVGVTGARISQLENRGDLIRPKKAILLAKVLKTTVEHLFGKPIAAKVAGVRQSKDRQHWQKDETIAA